MTSRFYEQSLYKLGWSQFKLAKHEESLIPFFDLLNIKILGVDIKEGEDRLEDLKRAERELVEDTFRVLSISFSYMGGAESIDAFLAARGYPEYSYVIFMKSRRPVSGERTLRRCCRDLRRVRHA